MSKNRFVVDLSDITLKDEDRKRINLVLQQAVSRELLNIARADNPVAFPFIEHDEDQIKLILGDQPVFTNGVIIRDLDKEALNGFVKLKAKPSR